MKSLHYRPDIDGLRAVAIGSVVLYHLDFSTFSGGYTGVDVFFVISGFLITSILYREIGNRSFSFISFYERRIRRIFPALFAVFLGTSACAYFLLLPKDLESFFQSITAATLFSSNILFWKTAGYFDWPAEMKPLLHTWSLSIEEQFYIVYPLLLLWMARLAPGRTPLCLAGIGLVSLFSSEFFLHGQSPSVFYLLHFRAWELLLGALLALDITSSPVPQSVREALSLIGLILIAVGVFIFDDQTLFPGVKALFPCLGAAMIIYAGKQGHTVIGKLLSLKPLVWIGLISYSLYLWHWPLIVFAKYYVVHPLENHEKAILLIFSFFLAAVSWRFVERPFRGKSGVLSRKTLIGSAVLGMSGFVAVGLLGHFAKGFPGRLPDSVVALADASFKTRQLDGNCIDISRSRIDNGEACLLGDNSATPASFVVWGDSHALAMGEAIHLAADKIGVTGLLFAHSSCPPLLEVERFDAFERGCREFNQATRLWLEKNKNIRTVFLVARWAISAEGTRYGSEPGRPVVISSEGIKGNPQALKAGLQRTLHFLNERGIRVVLVAQMPEIGWNVPSTLARAQLFGHHVSMVMPTYEAYRERQHTMSRIIDELSAQYPFKVFEVARVMCPSDACLIEKGGRSFYKDDDHISIYGAELLAEPLTDMFQTHLADYRHER